ncbi:hypothetical protein [Streptomyces sp. NBC_01304]|uniref:hypothetical protein n=1 Tax=Streptomyces sp. NBC_01304 TaxID=2903818 RepID=UPI002E15791D|nr:hypothetical protein OG430_34175 [Streptomyces sp. NBC_01304]
MTGKRALQILRRLTVHEFKAAYSLVLWVGRRRHEVREGDHPAAYTGPQTAMLYGLLFVAVVETVVLAVLIPWPVVHAMLLFVDVYTIIQVIGLHAACVTRPHVVGADGALRVRYGALFDLRIPADDIAHARVDRRYPTGRHFELSEDGTLDVIVGSQTTVTVELARPTRFVRPLGAVGHARVLRINADDPGALVAALRQARTGPSPIPDRPA